MIYHLLGRGFGPCNRWLPAAGSAYFFNFFVFPSPPKSKFKEMVVSIPRRCAVGTKKAIQNRSKINRKSIETLKLFSTSLFDQLFVRFCSFQRSKMLIVHWRGVIFHKILASYIESKNDSKTCKNCFQNQSKSENISKTHKLLTPKWKPSEIHMALARPP